MGPKANINEAMFGIGAAVAPQVAAVMAACGSSSVSGYWLVAALDMLFVPICLVMPLVNPKFVQLPDDKSMFLLADGKVSNVSKDEHPASWYCVLLCACSIFLVNAAENTISFWLYSYCLNLGLSENTSWTI